MTLRTRYTTVIAVILCLAPTAWGQQYLRYVPQQVASGQKAPSQEGILVREIEIRKGDTLYDISRTFSGHGMYYPQILLFNSIKNPNLIYSGKILKVPVTQNEVNASEHRTTPATAAHHKRGGKKKIVSAGKGTVHKTRREEGTGAARSAVPAKIVAAVPASGSPSAGQQLFEAAVTAYRHDDCRTAIPLLDRYLAENPASLLAADANLYKADCYLKLSTQ